MLLPVYHNPNHELKKPSTYNRGLSITIEHGNLLSLRTTGSTFKGLLVGGAIQVVHAKGGAVVRIAWKPWR